MTITIELWSWSMAAVLKIWVIVKFWVRWWKLYIAEIFMSACTAITYCTAISSWSITLGANPRFLETNRCHTHICKNWENIKICMHSIQKMMFPSKLSERSLFCSHFPPYAYVKNTKLFSIWPQTCGLHCQKHTHTLRVHLPKNTSTFLIRFIAIFNFYSKFKLLLCH